MTGPPPPTVGDAMLRHPTVHPAGLSVGEARAAFSGSPKTHLLLLVDGGTLLGTLTRADLDTDADASSAAERLGSLAGRTVAPDVGLEATRQLMLAQRLRRLAVVDGSSRLLGLLCLQRSLSGFCSDDGVARMRRDRLVEAPAQ